jgi:hypothetical protein
MKMKKWIAEKIFLLSIKIENLAFRIYDPDEERDFNIMHTDAGHVIMFPTNEDGCDCEGCDCL